MSVPKESLESELLANWLDGLDYTFSAIRNESDSHSFYKGKSRVKSGVRKGIPDFYIILKRGKNCFIELKRQKPLSKVMRNGEYKQLASPSKVSKEQEEWIKKINSVENNCARICFGFKEATDFIIEQEAK